MHVLKYFFIITICFLSGCKAVDKKTNKDLSPYTFNYLALGDSYTKGESVCKACGFPQQLKKLLEEKQEREVSVIQIAETGWTTTQLKNAIAKQPLKNSYDFVTLLIGVNNQFQGKPFKLYQTEFEELLETAITYAGGDVSKVLVLSIPDYGFTPYGEASGEKQKISAEIDVYNTFAEKAATKRQVQFITITDITRQGLEKTTLVADDGLHPSKVAYQLFTERILEYIEL